MSGVRRLSRVQRRILRRLAEAPSYGFALATELGLWTATVYPALQRLEESALVHSYLEPGSPADLGRPLRRMFRLTRDGARLAASVADEAAAAPKGSKRRRTAWA